MIEQSNIFSLKQVVSSIRKTIEERYQKTYWVKAEMHKLNQFGSGHCFPELLEKQDGKIVAQISGSIWKHNFDRINQRFLTIAKEPLKEDTTLLLNVKIVFHETYGMSLQILDIDPNYSLGELQRERLQTLEKLKKNNLLNKNQSLEFPLLPKNIAVISAESSKGYSDFMQVLQRNQYGYQISTHLFSAYLQGDNAANSIISQLKIISENISKYDAVVIVRGGGGEVGLSCYNNYSLCAEIASFPLPILTGIGHSTNLTVAEMIAYRNAITPTELAETLIHAFRTFDLELTGIFSKIQNQVMAYLKAEKIDLSHTIEKFDSSTIKRITFEKNELKALKVKINASTKFVFFQEKQFMTNTIQSINEGSRRLIKTRFSEIDTIVHKLPNLIRINLNNSKVQLNHLDQKLNILSPVNILKRGYSISTFNGKTLNKNQQIKVGDVIVTQTYDSKYESEIIKIKQDEN